MTKFLELCFAGVALGAQYALVALGFVVIYRATSVINFAQGGFVMLGAYLAYDFHQTWGLPFYVAVVLAMVGGAIVGALVEVLILRRLLGRPPFVIIMVTIGLLILIEQLVPIVWGQDPLPLGDPWGVRSVKLGDVALAVADFWTLGIVAVVLVVFFLYFKYSRMGVAMRATASDQEAALAQGIGAGLVIGVSWAIAGAVAALAGVTLAGGGGGVRLDIELVALTAFPAIILGGLDSPGRCGRRRARDRARPVARLRVPARVRAVAGQRLRPRAAVHHHGDRLAGPALRVLRPAGGATGLMARLLSVGHPAGGRPSRSLVRRTQDRLHLTSSWSQRVFLVVLALVWVATPSYLSDYWLDVLARCGLAAIGAIGLNLLTGYTGQISLGHAFFIGVGAYVAAWFGVQQQMPLLVWLPLCAIIGGFIGGVIGPFALRLRGNYLAIVTVGLLYIGNLIFNNWDSLTGGHAGTATAAPVSIGPLDFADLHLFGQVWSRRQGLFWLVWLLVALAALLAKNLVRTRPGRAMQAVRDQDVAAEVVGVNVALYKVGAFAVSSAFAAVAGGLFGVVQQFVNPSDFGGAPGLLLSITYVAMIIVGGMGTIGGSVVGALVVVGLPNVIQQINQSIAIPFVKSSPTATDGVITVFQLNQLLFGVLIILFLLFESRGLAAVWQRAKRYVVSWPFPS